MIDAPGYPRTLAEVPPGVHESEELDEPSNGDDEVISATVGTSVIENIILALHSFSQSWINPLSVAKKTRRTSPIMMTISSATIIFLRCVVCRHRQKGCGEMV